MSSNNDGVTITGISATRVLPYSDEYMETDSLLANESAKVLMSRFPQKVATVAALKALVIANAVDGQCVIVQGYYAGGDGGGGQFRFSSASVAADDGGAVIQPTVGAGRWLRQFSPSLTFCPRMWGAKADSATDDSAAFAAAIAYVVANYSTGATDQKAGNILVSPGNYRIATLVNASALSLLAGAALGSVKLIVDTAVGFTAGAATNFRNISFKSATNLTNKAINYSVGGYLSNLDDCRFEAFATCVSFGAATTKHSVRKCFFEGVAIGLDYGSFVVTTTLHADNHFNTVTTAAIITGNAINCMYSNNVFEDSIAGIRVNVQLSQSVLVNNWAEKAAAASTKFLDDLTAGAAFLTSNFIIGTVLNGGATTDFGVNNVWGGPANFGLKMPHLIGNSSTPAIAAGVGAGAGPSVAIVGTDLGFKVTLTTGAGTAASSQLLLVTFASAFANVPHVVFAPGNDAAATLSGTSAVSPGVTDALFSLSSGTVALADSTVYVWECIVVG